MGLFDWLRRDRRRNSGSEKSVNMDMCKACGKELCKILEQAEHPNAEPGLQCSSCGVIFCFDCAKKHGMKCSECASGLRPYGPYFTAGLNIQP